MEWINDKNREYYIRRMARHFKRTTTEEELRKNIEKDPTILEDFVDYLVDSYEDERYMNE